MIHSHFKINKRRYQIYKSFRQCFICR